MKIATRILIGIVIIVFGGIYYLVDWLVSDIRPRYLESLEEPMVDFSHILAELLEADIVDNRIDAGDLAMAFDSVYKRQFSARIYQLHKTRVSLRAYVTDHKGIVIYDSEGKDEGSDFSVWRDVRLTLAGEYGARATRTREEDPATSIMYIAAPIFNKSGEIIGVVSVAKPTSTIMLFIETAKTKVATVGTVTGLTVIFLSVLLLMWITKPIARLTQYARQVRDGKKVSLPKLGSGGDIAELGGAFEEMRDALEGKNYIEKYVQTLTHEIKSPLSSIKGATELLSEDMPAEQRARFLQNISKESTRIQELIDRLLQLSTVEARKGLNNIEKINIESLLADALDSLAASIQHKNLTIKRATAALKNLTVSGEHFLLATSIINLLQNAIDFAPSGSELLIRADVQDNYLTLRIRNAGGHIPDYALDKLFDRFYSLPREHSKQRGTGLGLPFVREAALLHGGQAEVHNVDEASVEAVLQLPC